MHKVAFPECEVEGPYLPSVPYNHLGFRSNIPKKCSECGSLFEGSCARQINTKGYMELDYGPCGVDGPTEPIFYESKFFISKVEVPKKCNHCHYLEIDDVYGFNCNKDRQIWGKRRSLDWGSWKPNRLYVDLSPYIATREMHDAIHESDFMKFIRSFRKRNAGHSIKEGKLVFEEALSNLEKLEKEQGHEK